MLESTWFLLWAVLWIVYFVLDGFDLGVGMIYPFLSRKEKEKDILLHTIGPFWNGNEVWLIAAGGVTFAAFPEVYASLFSGLYIAFMLLLVGLILRGVSVELRSQLDNRAWKAVWETGIVLGSFLPALLLGVAFANIFRGLPIDAQGVHQGSFFGLLNPYGLLGGVVFVALFVVHGSIWAAFKTAGDLQARSGRLAQGLWPVLTILLVLFLVLSAVSTNLYSNYMLHPWLAVVPLLAVAGLLGMRRMIALRRWGASWIASAVTIAGSALFGVAGIYPALIPSSLNPAYSLTLSNASSSQLTLTIMLVVALIFVPIVLLYQIWCYRRFSHTVTEESLSADEAFY
jgi:cytochrome d ubiquinol oxidase subunit II